MNKFKVKPEMNKNRLFLIWIIILCIYVSELLIYTWSRVSCVRTGYEISAILSEQQYLIDLQKNLKIEIARLKSPSRIITIAKEKLGLTLPPGKEVSVDPPNHKESEKIIFGFWHIKEVDQISNVFELANHSINSPISMEPDETIIIVASIGQKNISEVFEERMAAKLTSYELEKTDFTGIPNSNRIEAILTGNSFQITPITPVLQAVGGSKPTTWKWQARALSEGMHYLHLSLSIIVSINDHDTPKVIRTYEKKIFIEITMTQAVKNFLRQHWQWFCAAILFPFVGFMFSILLKKRTTKEKLA